MKRTKVQRQIRFPLLTHSAKLFFSCLLTFLIYFGIIDDVTQNSFLTKIVAFSFVKQDIYYSVSRLVSTI